MKPQKKINKKWLIKWFSVVFDIFANGLLICIAYAIIRGLITKGVAEDIAVMFVALISSLSSTIPYVVKSIDISKYELVEFKKNEIEK